MTNHIHVIYFVDCNYEYFVRITLDPSLRRDDEQG